MPMAVFASLAAMRATAVFSFHSFARGLPAVSTQAHDWQPDPRKACRQHTSSFRGLFCRLVRCTSDDAASFKDIYIAPDPPDDESKKARAMLFRLLDARLYPAYTLDTKMKERGFSDAARQFAIESVQGLGLQSDREYADGFARTKWRNAKWAPARIRVALRQKRIPPGDIAAALEWLVEEGHKPAIFTADTSDREDCDAPRTASGAYGGAMMTQLLEEAAKRASHTEHLSRETRRRRLVGWLQRTGHPWPVVQEVLESLEL